MTKNTTTTVAITDPNALDTLCKELQALQRQRSIVLKSRNMQANRLQAVVAGTLGYSASLTEKERASLFAKASTVIKNVNEGKEDHPLKAVIKTTMIGIDAFEEMKLLFEKEMKALAKKLPVASWVDEPGQRGFGLPFLAIIVGETGNVSNYANPGKLWKRLGCAPHTFDGKTHMGASWRSGKYGKLPSEEWVKFGYSPRRRSIAYLVGVNLKMLNWTRSPDKSTVTWMGPYRQRYELAKPHFKSTHPDATDLHVDRHAMLVATKLLLKNLWARWHGVVPETAEQAAARLGG